MKILKILFIFTICGCVSFVEESEPEEDFKTINKTIEVKIKIS